MEGNNHLKEALKGSDRGESFKLSGKQNFRKTDHIIDIRSESQDKHDTYIKLLRTKRTKTHYKKMRIQARNEMNIAYCNVQGNVSRHNHESWFELSQLRSNSGWDIVMMTETHYQGYV